MADIPAIQIKKLAYHYSTSRIIMDKINITVKENDFIAIIGQNGSGKTTLLKLISGLLRQSKGDIYIRGRNTKEMDVAEISGEIGFSMQESDRQLFESTVYDEVAFALKHRGMNENDVKAKVEETLEAVGLLDKRDVFPLSMNRADRVKTVFASILAMGPRILMLDEPVAGQDKRGCRIIMDIIGELHRQNYTIILVTHNLGLAVEFANRIIVMKDAMVFMEGTPGEIFDRTGDLAIAKIIPPPITRLSQSLRKQIPLEKYALMPGELASMLVSLKHKSTTPPQATKLDPQLIHKNPEGAGARVGGEIRGSPPTEPPDH